MSASAEKRCCDCALYVKGETDIDDKCGHGRAVIGGAGTVVRGPQPAPKEPPSHYPCFAMRAGICGPEAALFEARTCECGAQLRGDEMMCLSCRVAYAHEENEELNRLFPPREP